jgi:hypothetical protein
VSLLLLVDGIQLQSQSANLVDLTTGTGPSAPVLSLLLENLTPAVSLFLQISCIQNRFKKQHCNTILQHWSIPL